MMTGLKRQILSAFDVERLSPHNVQRLRSPRLYQHLASRARLRGDWTSDAFYRRACCEVEPLRAGNWLQLGHALKELGSHGKAADAYRTALSLSPNSAEISMHLAHLEKMRGNFSESLRFFLDAQRFGHPAAGSIDGELALLDSIDNSVVYPARTRGSDKAAVHIYISAPVSAVAEDDSASLAAGLGQSDYSYAFAMRGFVRALEEIGYDYTILKNPEFVSDIRHRSNARTNIHLGFYPPERLRLLKGAYNINVFAWEFDRLRAPGEALSYHAFCDQATMLDTLDEVWLLSKHGAASVARGVRDTPVHAVPAPILGELCPAPRTARPNAGRVFRLAGELDGIDWQPLAVFARIQDMMNDEAARRRAPLADILRSAATKTAPLIFMTILNVHDFRKQLYPMLAGFLEFRQTHPDAILLIKMTTPDRGKLPINTFLLMEQISNAGALPRPLVSDHVWITDQLLSRDEMNALYDLSSFYVCTSHAEGQNLPILEAMGRGIVPVSVDHTAMADYISERSAVPVASTSRPFDPRLASRYGMYDIATNFVEPKDVRCALAAAAALTPKDYAARSATGHDIVTRDYGTEPVALALGRVVTALEGAGVKDA